MSGEEREALHEALAEAVREYSRAGKPAASQELFAALEAHELPALAPLDDQQREILLAETMAAHKDLSAMAGVSGRLLYHAPALLSLTYASIMDRRGNPVILIAEEVRRNSAEYPRPLPVDLFEASPFDLTPKEIESALAAMASSTEHRDITFTTTSTGAVYLFSTRHLERGFAEFLAERADTELLLNP